MKIAIVISEFNGNISTKLLEEAARGFVEEKITEEDLAVFYVPGALEIPVMLQKLADTKKYDGAIALGAVIKGETDHYEYVCRGVTDGVQKVSIENRWPVMFGVLTCQNEALALARASKGYECAKGLLQMIKMFRVIV